MSQTQTKKRPLYEAFSVSGEGDNSEWTKVGAVWENTKGVTLVIRDGLAVSGRVVCIAPREPDNPDGPQV